MRTGDALGGLYDALEGMDATEERSSRAVATVVGRDADGTVWVHVPGGVRATPARMCTVDVSPGDSVMVAFERNGVTVEGNASDPSAGTKGLARAEARADRAVEVAKSVRAELVEADRVIAGELEASRADIRELKANSATVGDLAAATGRIGTLEAATADIAEVRANSAKVANLTAAQLEADHAKVSALDADQISADHAAIGALDATYARVTLENVENSWIDRGVIRDAAISDAQIAGVSANKITAGTIDASKVNVTNLSAKNISVEKINGVSVTGKSVADALAAAEGEIDGVQSDISDLDSKLDNAVGDLNARVDAQIETWTAKAVPTLSNYPASDWGTDKLRAEHVGDVCYVVNAASEADGYTYRFAYDETSKQYMWVLIKDNQVTAALQRLLDAEGDISGLKSFQTETSHWIEETDEGVESLRARTTAVETDLGTKVETSTFNTLKNTVDENSSTITSLSTTAQKLRTDLDGLEVGGRNLLSGDAAMVHRWTNVMPAAVTLSGDEYEGYYLLVKGVGGWENVYSPPIPVEPRKTYTVSIDYSVDTAYTPYGAGDQRMFGLEVCTKANSTSNAYDAQLAKLPFGTAVKGRTRGSVTFTATSDTIWLHLDGGYIKDGSTNIGFIVSRLKLEEGDTATAWIPPYSDYATAESVTNVANTVNEVRQTADSNSAKISSLETATDGLTSRMTTAETSITQNREQIALRATREEAEQAALASGVEYIAGTQTAATNLWTGATREASLVAGKTIAYKLPYAGNSSAATLDLTLAGGGTTGAKPVRYNTSNSANNSVTNQYGAGAVVLMTYDGTCWRVSEFNTNTNNYDRRLHNNYVRAAGAVKSGALACGTSAGYVQLAASVAFDLSYPVLWAGGAWASGSQYANAYEAYPSVNPATTATVQGIAANRVVWLKGAVAGTTFTCAASDFLTCAVPTSADGLFYVPLGMVANDATTKMYFSTSDKLYAFLDGAFQRVDLSATTRVAAAEASIRVHADSIESKVSKGEVISSINQSAEGVRIQAKRIELDGTAVFDSISSRVGGTVTDAQAVYWQAEGAAAPSVAGLAWVEYVGECVTYEGGGEDDEATATRRWSAKPPTYSAAFPVTWVATQRRLLDGTVETSAPAMDDRMTVIDGGRIVANSVTAESIDAESLLAEGAAVTVAIGTAIDAATATLATAGDIADVQSDLADATTSLTEAIGSVGESADQTAGSVSELRGWVDIGSTADGDPALVMGKKGAGGAYDAATPLMRLTNRGLDIGVGDEALVQMLVEELEDGSRESVLRIMRAVIMGELRFGDYAFVARSNGNMALRYVGGDE